MSKTNTILPRSKTALYDHKKHYKIIHENHGSIQRFMVIQIKQILVYSILSNVKALFSRAKLTVLKLTMTNKNKNNTK